MLLCCFEKGFSFVRPRGSMLKYTLSGIIPWQVLTTLGDGICTSEELELMSLEIELIFANAACTQTARARGKSQCMGFDGTHLLPPRWCSLLLGSRAQS